jgi:hypothetical protein
MEPTWSRLVRAAAFVACANGSGCAGDDSTPAQSVCVPGATVACLGPGRCQGAQVCNADGTGYGECDCGADSSTVGSGGQPAVGGTGAGGTGGEPATGGGAATSGGSGNAGTDSGASGGTTGGDGGVGASSGTSGAAGTDSGASGGTTGGDGGVGASSGTSGAAGTGGACTDSANFVILVDRSGSMGDDPSGAWSHFSIRYGPLQAALLDFLQDPASASLMVSLEFFAAEGGMEEACSVAEYFPPNLAVPLTSLTSTTAFSTALEETVPGGGTPTWPAVRGALDYAEQIAAESGPTPTVVVLITDGEPGLMSPPVDDPEGDVTMKETCYEHGFTPVPNTMPQVASIVQAAFEGSYAIRTYAIGVSVVGGLANLDLVAAAGGTELATLVSDADPELTRELVADTLTSIRDALLDC